MNMLALLIGTGLLVGFLLASYVVGRIISGRPPDGRGDIFLLTCGGALGVAVFLLLMIFAYTIALRIIS